MKPLPKHKHYYLKSFLLLLSVASCFYTAGQNLIVNGSMTSPKGAGVVTPGWVKSSNLPTNTPDINDSSGPLLSTFGLNWAGGTPIPSPDGGTWQNTFFGEGVTQVINSITVGAIYYFSYYYTSQSITTFPNNVAPPNVTINGATGYVNPDFSGTLFQWNSYCGALIADSTSIVITATGPLDNETYMAYDGFYLSQTPLSFTQITQQPASTSVCDSSGASFSIQAPGADQYFWQLNDGSGWAYLSDTGPYSGSHTDSLGISHADSSKNGYQYRCYIVGPTCPVYSSVATLTVFPLPAPSFIVNAASPQICAGDSITIMTNPSYQSYLWSNGSTANAITINQPGEYPIAVKDNNNCMGKDSINIAPCENFFIPNAFTPNGDGINDVFKPVIYGNVLHYQFSVYSRWGQLVFQTTDVSQGWNGLFHRSREEPAVFVWTCRFSEAMRNLKKER